MSAREQLERMMALTPYLRRHADGVPLSRLAADFGVSTRVIRKDLETLWMCGLPGLLPDDLVEVEFDAHDDDPEGLVRITNADFMPRPTRLGSGEAASLLVALETMRGTGDAETQVLVEQLVTKLELASAEGATGRVAVVPPTPATPPTEAAEVRSRLEEALAQGRQIRLRHLHAARDEVLERVVDPIALLTHDQLVYLDAWCHRADDRRLFRLDRIQSAALLETPVEERSLEPRDLGEQGVFTPHPDDPVVTLSLAPAARWLADYHPVRSAREAADGSLEIVLHVSDPRWLVRTVLAAAPAVTVLAPPEFAARVTEAALATVAAYDGEARQTPLEGRP